MRYGLGIDLGTTSVAAAIATSDAAEAIILGERTPTVPAVVHVAADGSITTGEAAARRSTAEPQGLVRNLWRRLGEPVPVAIGGGTFPVAALMAALLRDVVAKVTELHGAPQRVVLTRPATWGRSRLAQLSDVAARAGIPAATTVSEPQAAAIRYAASGQLSVGGAIAVYDFGGGSFEGAVLARGPNGVDLAGPPEGVDRLGGVDIDDLLFAHLDRSCGGDLGRLDRRDPKAGAAFDRTLAECTLAKEVLSTEPEVEVPVYLPDRLHHVVVTRSDLDALLRGPVGATVAALKRALQAARRSPADLDAVLLVGGSARIPLVAAMVTEALDGATRVEVVKEPIVALGAALFAAQTPAATEQPDVPAAPRQGQQQVAGPRPAPSNPNAAEPTTRIGPPRAPSRSPRPGPQPPPTPPRPAPPPPGPSRRPAAPHGATPAGPPATFNAPPRGPGRPPPRVGPPPGPPDSHPPRPGRAPAGPPPDDPTVAIPPQRRPTGSDPRRVGPPIDKPTVVTNAAQRGSARPGAGPRSAARPDAAPPDAGRSTPRDGTPEPPPDEDWHTPSTGRRLAVGVAVVAVLLAIAVIIFVVVNRVGSSTSGMSTTPQPTSSVAVQETSCACPVPLL